jgi:hypothetical protein
VLDRFAVKGRNGALVPRRLNPGWQQYLYDYLTRARVFIICRASFDGMDDAYLRSYQQFPLISGPSARGDVMRLGRGSAS